MVSREQHYERIVHLDPAAAMVGVSWADPAAVEFSPQLLAALGQYLSSGHRRDDDDHEDDAAEAEAEADDEFMMYEFKVRRCARARSHDWTACPYAHPGEAARRRDPRRAAYAGEPCPDFRRRPPCPRGNACPLAHGTFELWLHPSRYRTRPCRAGGSCARRVCFFAHAPAELRSGSGSGAATTKEEEEQCPVPLSLSPKSTLGASLIWESSSSSSPPVSPVQGRLGWTDVEPDPDEAEVEDLMLAMRGLGLRKATAPAAAPALLLPPVTDEDGPDLGWVSELVM